MRHDRQAAIEHGGENAQFWSLGQASTSLLGVWVVVLFLGPEELNDFQSNEV
jgi:hypothetical protein